MNNIDEMPPKCHDCPYWEICEEPYICPTQDEKKEHKQEFEMEYLRCAAIINGIVILTFLIGVSIYQLYLLIKGK